MNRLIPWILILCLLPTSFFSVSPIFAEELDLFPEHEKKEVSTHQKVMEYLNGKRHFKKRKGVQDPHFPRDISLTPAQIQLPLELQYTQIRPSIQNHALHIDQLTEEQLLNLHDKDLTSLLDYLSEQKCHIHLHYGKKWHIHSRHALFPKKANAVAALALLMGVKKNHQALTQILSLKPETVLQALSEKGTPLLCKKVTAKALIKLMQQLNHTNSKEISLSAAHLVNTYVSYWAGKDAEKLDESLRALVIETRERMKELPQSFSPKQLGILLGSLLAGTLQHSHKIKSTDERRLWDVNTTTNIIWATSTFLGVAPWFAGNVTAALAGTISLGAVLGQASYNYFRRPRDYSDIVKHIKGQIEMSALETLEIHEPNIPGESEHSHNETELNEKLNTLTRQVSILQQRDTVLEMLEWMNASVHLNGLAN